MRTGSLVAFAFIVESTFSIAMGQEHLSTSEAVTGDYFFRRAIDAQGSIPPDTTNRFRNPTTINFDTLAMKWGCMTRHKGIENYDGAYREGINIFRRDESNRLEGVCQIHMIVSRNGSADARKRLFEFLWSSSGSSAADGVVFRSSQLGDFYLAHRMALKETNGQVRVTSTIAFCRDNIAASIRGDDYSTDLFPVASDLDAAIQSCPLKPTPEEAGLTSAPGSAPGSVP